MDHFIALRTSDHVTIKIQLNHLLTLPQNPVRQKYEAVLSNWEAVILVAAAATDPITGEEAVAASTAATMRVAVPAGTHGGDRRSEKVDQGDHITLKDRGTAAGYLAARIKRDHPDIAARVEAGEFKSMRARITFPN